MFGQNRGMGGFTVFAHYHERFFPYYSNSNKFKIEGMILINIFLEQSGEQL